MLDLPPIPEIVREDETRGHIYRLRARVWSNDGAEFPAGVTEWVDEFDAGAIHWAVMANGLPIAASRMTIHRSLDELIRVPNPTDPTALRSMIDGIEIPIGYQGRLVVAPEAQGRGLAKLLVNTMIAQAGTFGCRTIFGLTSNPKVAHIYQGHGFRISSDPQLAIGLTRRRGVVLLRSA